ncbi:MAG TPA: hypothetical protein VIF62_00830 [Labilithrix sp.]
MSSATMRCATLFASDERLPETQPRSEAVTFDSGIYRMASRRGFDARNAIGTMRVNVEFLRAMLAGSASENVVDALDDIFAAADRLETIVDDISR